MNTAKIPTIIFTGLLTFFAACSPSEQGESGAVDAPAEVIALEGTNWELLQMKVLGGFVFTAEDPGMYVLNFRSENRLTGKSDCNQLSGSWVQENLAFHFEPFTSTRKLCPPGSLHNNLVLYLRDATALEFRGENMVITTTTEGVEMEFQLRDN